MKIIFAGTPEIAATALQILINSEHQICAVLTQPDRPAGRGRKLTASPVKELAEKAKLAIHQPTTLRDATIQHILKAYQADAMIVVAYGLILPTKILNLFKYGCINVHVSLLPRWRGAAPIQRAIQAGDKETGVTIMQMDEGLDTGDILLQKTCAIEVNDTNASLHDRLAELGGEALLETLKQIDHIKPQKQDETYASYAHKISKQEAHINWHKTAIEIDRQIRAFNPWPVAFTQLHDKTLRIWQATIIEKNSQQTPGSIIATSTAGIDVATGEHILRLKKVQLQGGKVLDSATFINGHKHWFANNSRIAFI